MTTLNNTDLLMEAERALNQAKNFKYPSKNGLKNSYALTAEIGKTLSEYTVILLYPDYASDNYGQEHYITTLEASNPNVAIIRAQQRAFEASNDEDADTRSVEINDPEDFFVVAVICGRAAFAEWGK